MVDTDHRLAHFLSPLGYDSGLRLGPEHVHDLRSRTGLRFPMAGTGPQRHTVCVAAPSSICPKSLREVMNLRILGGSRTLVSGDEGVLQAACRPTRERTSNDSLGKPRVYERVLVGRGGPRFVCAEKRGTQLNAVNTRDEQRGHLPPGVDATRCDQRQGDHLANHKHQFTQGRYTGFVCNTKRCSVPTSTWSLHAEGIDALAHSRQSFAE